MSYPRDATIEEELAEVQARSHAGDFSSGDSEVESNLARPLHMTLRHGDVAIYHTLEHDVRIVPEGDILNQALRKRLPDGKRAFSIHQQGNPVRGTIKCHMHPEHPDREKWRGLGFLNDCVAGGFTSEMDALAHMAGRHRRDWLRMKEQLDREERDMDRAFQREILARLTSNVPQQAVSQETLATEPQASAAPAELIRMAYVSTEGAAPAVFEYKVTTDPLLNIDVSELQPNSVQIVKPTPLMVDCPDCGKEVKMAGLPMHQRRWCEKKPQ